MKPHLPLALLVGICLLDIAVADTVFTENTDQSTLTITGVSGDGALTKFSELMQGKDGYTIVFDMADPGTSNTWYKNGQETIAHNILIGATDGEHGMRFYNGASSSVLTFTGTVTGAGTLSKEGASSANLVFSGDVHAYTGHIIVGSSASYGSEDTILFGGAGATNASTATQGVSGTGTITFKTANDAIGYNYSTGSTVYITNAIATYGDSAQSKIRIEGSDAIVFTQNVSINTLEVKNATADLSFNGAGTIGTITGTARSIAKNGNNTLILTGTSGLDTQTFLVNQGTLQYKNTGSGHFGTVQMASGANLAFYNSSNTSGDHILKVDHLQLDGDATVSNVYHAGSIQIEQLTGENKTLTLDAAAATSQSQWVSINGGNFSGTLDIRQTNAANGRKFVVVATDTDALAHAVIDLNTKRSGSDSLLAFAVGGEAGHTVNIAGLTGIADSYVISSGLTPNISLMTLAAIQDGETRTLGLTGSGTYEYNGTIGSNLIIDKSGTGAQILHNISDNVTMNVTGGSLTLAGTLGENVLLGAGDGTTVTKSGDGKLILTELGENATFNLENGSLWIHGTVGSGAGIVTSAGTSVYIGWQVAETAAGSGIYTANLPGADSMPDYITGEGSILFDSSSLVAKGDTSLHPSNRIFTRVDATGFTGDSLEITAGLVSVLSGDLSSPGSMADFGSISTIVLNGGGLVLNTEQSDFNAVLNQNIQIGERSGYLRSYRNSNLEISGSISGTGSLIKTDAGALTLSGDMSNFSGAVIVGEGGLVFKTNATVASLQMGGNDFDTFISVRNGKTLAVTSDTWALTAGANDIRLGEGAQVAGNRLRFSEVSSLNLTAEDNSHGSMTLSGIQCADMGNTTIHVGAATTLNLTGSETGAGKLHDVFNSSATFLITHYNAHADITVDGTLNMLNCESLSAVNLNNANSTLTVNTGGELNFKGLGLVFRDSQTGSKNVVVTLNAGAAMHLGSGGIDNQARLELNLNGGTVGILDSAATWSTERALVLGADITFDTRHYTAATDGQAGTYSDTSGGTIVLKGALSGEGGLIKDGIGTLELGAANLYTGATRVNAGDLLVSGSIGSSSSSNTYSVGKNAAVKLSGSGSIANSGATISARAEQAAREAVVNPGAVMKNISLTETALSRQSSDGTGRVENGRIGITGTNTFAIEHIELVNSLVSLQQACTLTLNNVAFDAGSALERADGVTGGSVTMTGQSNSLTIGLTGNTEVASSTIAYNGRDYANLTTTQLTGVQMDANGKLTIDLTDALLSSALKGGTSLAVTIDGFTGKDTAFSANDFELSDHLLTNVGIPSISGVGTNETGGTVVYIDFKEQIPEPGSSLLGLAGFTGLILRRRRRA